MSSTKFVFLGWSEKRNGRPGLWLAETFSTSPLKPLNGIQQNLIRSKIWTSSTKFYVFRTDRKNKMAALTSDWLRHFRILLWNRLTELNETWQEARSQCPLPSLSFSCRSENKMAALASDWLRHFRVLLLTELNKTCREGRSQCPLPSFSFSRWPPWPLIVWDIFDFSSETAEQKLMKLDRKQDLKVLYQVCVFRADRKNKMAALAETFSTSPLKPLNRIEQNLTRSKISMSSTKFVFFLPIRKTRWPPWLLIDWDIFNFSSETAEWISTQLDRKQDLNFLYQVCLFQAHQ